MVKLMAKNSLDKVIKRGLELADFEGIPCQLVSVIDAVRTSNIRASALQFRPLLTGDFDLCL